MHESFNCKKILLYFCHNVRRCSNYHKYINWNKIKLKKNQTGDLPTLPITIIQATHPVNHHQIEIIISGEYLYSVGLLIISITHAGLFSFASTTHSTNEKGKSPSIILAFSWVFSIFAIYHRAKFLQLIAKANLNSFLFGYYPIPTLPFPSNQCHHLIWDAAQQLSFHYFC